MKNKVLVFDIETAPILGYVWGLWENNLGVNQIHSDWYILSWAAKWLGEKTVLHQDQSKAKNIEDDKHLLKGIWSLLDKADIVVTQNGKAFDQKKLNARFVINGMQPPSSFKHIDTKQLAKKHFAFTSNSLEYMSDKLCIKYKKLKHPEFEGFSLWKECLKGNQKAWKEMKKYNVHDVLALEELYMKLVPWDTSINFLNITGDQCSCGANKVIKYGYVYTKTGKFQRYKCSECGKESKGRKSISFVDRTSVA